ncbi:NADPH-dependent FMN reductase [Acidocella sp.]|uniref:NADPH-dependent FMN reductase n=1 Tax=Acidocella sp. TaxID=50710 RepID=UPI003D01A23E
MSEPIRLLGISGSIRKASTNTIVLHTLSEALVTSGKATLEVFPLDDVPLYNGDLEADLPAPVAALKSAITAADGLVLVTPEFNHGIPGVLKNAIDWASRPAFAAPLVGKPVLPITSSPGFVGGARVHAQLLATLHSTLSRVVVGPDVVIAGIGQKITNGRLTDATTLEFCLKAIDTLLAEIRIFSRTAA